jgi:hypothetical protein
MNNVEAIKALTEGAGSFDVVTAALAWPASDNRFGFSKVWESLASTIDDAEAYLASLPTEDALEEAALAFDAAGWTPAKINLRRS